ncbi:unnamed protein product [Ranitomeya imitator]|uniref:Coiled-coil-domain-containing protein 138 coiled-coil domain-containing protein n=1 Tax=Ranitomeya imitator TaxID=111125 RepID=A0ABN9KMS1_9NEOB|nr:unnamed protein product [Ranitomeya imitator]
MVDGVFLHVCIAILTCKQSAASAFPSAPALNEVSVQNKKLETQAKKVQSRLENLQRKHSFLTVQKSKDIYQTVQLPKPQNVEKKPAVKPKNFQITTLYFGLSTSPRVFRGVMAAVTFLLHPRGVVVLPYLVDLLAALPALC